VRTCGATNAVPLSKKNPTHATHRNQLIMSYPHTIEIEIGVGQ
jgi:hypothetical protein